MTPTERRLKRRSEEEAASSRERAEGYRRALDGLKQECGCVHIQDLEKERRLRARITEEEKRAEHYEQWARAYETEERKTLMKETPPQAGSVRMDADSYRKLGELARAEAARNLAEVRLNWTSLLLWEALGDYAEADDAEGVRVTKELFELLNLDVEAERTGAAQAMPPGASPAKLRAYAHVVGRAEVHRAAYKERSELVANYERFDDRENADHWRNLAEESLAEAERYEREAALLKDGGGGLEIKWRA